MACFLIMAVAPLNRRWLYMEHTAFSASERLSDLTSREGDSFLDELCTMSGNVQQVVEALEFCMQVCGGEGRGHQCYSVVCMSNCCRLCNDDACSTAPCWHTGPFMSVPCVTADASLPAVHPAGTHQGELLVAVLHRVLA